MAISALLILKCSERLCYITSEKTCRGRKFPTSISIGIPTPTPQQLALFSVYSKIFLQVIMIKELNSKASEIAHLKHHICMSEVGICTNVQIQSTDSTNTG